MIVTISREFGAGAITVARVVAKRCGYRLVIDEVPDRVAARLGIRSDDVDMEEETKRPFIDRISLVLPGSALDVSAIPDESIAGLASLTRREVEAAVGEEAEQGDVVIVGRAASQILGTRTDLVRIFLHAPVSWRIERVVEWFGYSAKMAAQEIRRLDAARAEYLMDNYSTVWGDARAYDLCIDVSRCGFDVASELIITAVAARLDTA